ncbi:uncharacterized protein LOC113352171 [Papaver somniferum]|uniref:uncharacterized protein LOC113352171 n=1 Tax=Papaver somniferum TaxID=3469 RepID=UPI000E6FFFD4|nr:uncharacterized protein LOC113352171 [Papaver somniferum]
MGEDAAEPPTFDKLIEVQIGDEKHKTMFVGAYLPAHERDGLNADVFAWSFADMPGINPNTACHMLNIDEKYHPVRQKIRNMAQRKKDGVTAEVEKLLEAGFIRAVQYARWLSNVVPVPKKNGKIRVCIGFTDLNKACTSDPYPLPRIRYLVDATSGGVYCYTVMSFGLKNTGETYQHLVDHMFKDLIGKTMEVYIDDMVVKSKQKESHSLDLHKTFDILRKVPWILEDAQRNRGKSGANQSHQRDAILKNKEGGLAGRLATLNRFISRSSDRFKPFFDVLKKTVNFGRTDECEKAFNEIKQYLSTPLVLVSPKTGQPIGVYLAATENAVSAVLFFTDPNEKPVYFVCKSLTGAETRYKNIEKIALSQFHASRRLKPYFQGRTAEKGYALVAFLADFPVEDVETVIEEEEELLSKPTESTTGQAKGEFAMEVDTPEPLWTIFTDGSSNIGGAGVGCVILTPEEAIIGLKSVKQLDARNVKLVIDSMLVVNQFLGTYGAKEERITLYLDHTRELANEFDQFSIGQRPRLENMHADALAYLSSAVDTDTTRFVVVDFQELPSISDSHFVLAIEHASGGERQTTSVQGDTENVDSNMDVDSLVIDDSSSSAENTSDWRQLYVRYLKTSGLP